MRRARPLNCRALRTAWRLKHQARGLAKTRENHESSGQPFRTDGDAVSGPVIATEGEPHHMAMNSQATSLTSLPPYQSTIAACFVFRRENCRTAIWNFCNKIGTKLPIQDVRPVVAIG